jgi:hypothetical protein
MRDEPEHKGDSEAVGVGARRSGDAEGVSVEIRPTPAAEEREAILRALAALDGRKHGGSSAWWAAGVREAIEEDPDE